MRVIKINVLIMLGRAHANDNHKPFNNQKLSRRDNNSKKKIEKKTRNIRTLRIECKSEWELSIWQNILRIRFNRTAMWTWWNVIYLWRWETLVKTINDNVCQIFFSLLFFSVHHSICSVIRISNEANSNEIFFVHILSKCFR